MPITPVQRELLVAIARLSRRGYPPTIRELAVQMAWRSTHTVLSSLTRLKKKQLVRWDPDLPRTLTLAAGIFEHKGEIYRIELFGDEEERAAS